MEICGAPKWEVSFPGEYEISQAKLHFRHNQSQPQCVILFLGGGREVRGGDPQYMPCLPRCTMEGQPAILKVHLSKKNKIRANKFASPNTYLGLD